MILPASRFRARIPAVLLALVALVVVSLPAQAQRAFSPRYSTIANGDIAGIGNVNMHCNPAAGNATQQAACVASRTHTAGSGGLNNNSTNVSMIHLDVDSDPTTINSSSATLSLPAGSTVLFAGLYWSAQGSNVTPNRNQVRFAASGGPYQTITASQFDSLTGGASGHPDYQSFADVTGLVTGSGEYTVANIATSRNTANNTWAGWALVVAYRNNTLPLRSLSVFDGWQRADGNTPILNLSVGPFITPPTGPVTSKLGALAWDGDRATNDNGNGLEFGPNTASLSVVTNAINPAQNFWNSTISDNGSHVTAGRTPNYTNTLGMDLDYQAPNVPLPNGATQAAIRLRGSANEHIDIGMVSLATDIFAPDLVSSITKEVTEVNGAPYTAGDPVEPGDVLTYTIDFENSGQDGATNVVLTDPIPAGTTYEAGSLVVLTNDTDGTTNGGAIGAMTDAADGDVAEFSGGNVVFRLGIDDSTWDGGIGLSNGGMISAGHSGSFQFQVRVNDDVAAGATITNTVSVTHNAQTIPDFDATGEAEDTVTVSNETDLSIVKTVDPANASIGDSVTYTLEVGNLGPLSVENAIVRDPPVAGLDCSAAVLSCSAAGDAECPVSPDIATLQGAGLVVPMLPVGGTVSIEFTCVVTDTP